jgi:hypothetical protein
MACSGRESGCRAEKRRGFDPGGVAACSRWLRVVCDTTGKIGQGFRTLEGPWKGASALILQLGWHPSGVRSCEISLPVVSQTALNHRLQAATPSGVKKKPSPSQRSWRHILAHGVSGEYLLDTQLTSRVCVRSFRRGQAFALSDPSAVADGSRLGEGDPSATADGQNMACVIVCQVSDCRVSRGDRRIMV